MTPVQRRLTPWLDVVAEALRCTGPEVPFRPLMQPFAECFGASVGWNSFGPGRRFAIKLHGAPPGFPDPDLVRSWVGHVHEHPLMRWQLLTGDPSAMTIGRVPKAMVNDRGREVVAEYLAPYGLEEQLSIVCTLRPGRVRAFVLARSGEDFSEEDLCLARQLQPLLALVARQADVLAESPVPCDNHAGLTDRELAILGLLDRGLTATAIGHRLGISPRTVHKHLEHVYRKLGVRDRLLASQAAREAGLLGPAATGRPDRAPPVSVSVGPGRS